MPPFPEDWKAESLRPRPEKRIVEIVRQCREPGRRARDAGGGGVQDAAGTFLQIELEEAEGRDGMDAHLAAVGGECRTGRVDRGDGVGEVEGRSARASPAWACARPGRN